MIAYNWNDVELSEAAKLVNTRDETLSLSGWMPANHAELRI